MLILNVGVYAYTANVGVYVYTANVIFKVLLADFNTLQALRHLSGQWPTEIPRLVPCTT